MLLDININLVEVNYSNQKCLKNISALYNSSNCIITATTFKNKHEIELMNLKDLKKKKLSECQQN